VAIIEGGNIIHGGVVMPGTVTRRYGITGAPVAGTTLAGIIAPGEFVQDVDTKNLYEYSEPSGVATFTRIDTVDGA
jgi:hypothetical protein